MAYSPNGCYLATVGKDSTARLWDVANGQEIARMRLTAGPDFKTLWLLAQTAHISPPLAKPQLLKYGRCLSGRELTPLRNAYAAVTALAFSPDGKYLVSGGYHGTIQQWDLATGKQSRRRQHKAAIVAIRFSPDGRLMVTAGSDRLARVWETSSGKEVVRLKHRAAITTVEFTPKGEYIITTDEDGIVHVWQTRSFQISYRLRPQSDAIVPALAFSQGGDFFFTSTVATPGLLVKQNGVYAWETATGGALGSMTYEGDVNVKRSAPTQTYLGQRISMAPSIYGT